MHELAEQERMQDAIRLLSLVAAGLAGIAEARELAAHLGLSAEFNQSLKREKEKRYADHA